MTPEMRWIEWLGTRSDAKRALRAFAPQYYYFSCRQVVAFSALLKQVDPLDRDSLAMLADVLYEELGRGSADRVHSKLFARFAIALDLTPGELLLDAAEVLPGVQAYVGELDRAFGLGSRPEALATYVFLESSAVDTYGPLLAVLRTAGFADEDLEFFELHAEVEGEHAAAADSMLRRYDLDAVSPVVSAQREKLAGLWHAFWSEIDDMCRQAISA